MAFTVIREEIAPMVGFTEIPDSKFKTNYVSVRFASKLNENDVSKNALAISLLSSANSKYPTQSAFSRKLSTLYGANFGSDTSKLGDNQILSLHASFIDDKYTIDNENLISDMTELVLDCIFSPCLGENGFDDSLFTQRKQNLIDDIEAEINDKQTYAIVSANKTIFKNEPFSMTPNGSKELVEQCGSDDVYQAYKNLLKTARIEICFVGNNGKYMKEAFKKAFENIEREPQDIEFYAKSKIKSVSESINEKMDVNQCKLVMAFKSDSDDHYALAFMNVILGATPFSKLFANVREKMSLCYYCSSSYNEAKGTICVSSGVDFNNVEKAKTEIQNQLDDIKSGNFSDDDMHNSLLSIINSIGSVDDYPGSIASNYFRRILKGEITTSEQEIEKYRSVTKERICKAAASLELDTVYLMEALDGTDN